MIIHGPEDKNGSKRARPYAADFPALSLGSDAVEFDTKNGADTVLRKRGGCGWIFVNGRFADVSVRAIGRILMNNPLETMKLVDVSPDHQEAWTIPVKPPRSCGGDDDVSVGRQLSSAVGYAMVR